MITIDVTSDIDAAIASVGEFFRGQVPFATSVAINNSVHDIRNEIVTVTWPKSFKMRNRVFPGRLFRVTKKSTKSDLVARVGMGINGRGYEDMVESQAEGGMRKKKSLGSRIAVPAQPDKMRTATGRIRAPLKPRNLKGTYTVKTGTRTLVLRRIGRQKKATVMYVIVPSAKIPKRFRFYEDATTTAIRVFPGYWRVAMNAAIATSRFRAK